MATIDYIIGLPPDNWDSRTNTVMRNSMPLCYISPGVPSFTEGITLFRRTPLFTTNANDKNKGQLSYTKLLTDQNVTLKQPDGNQSSPNGSLVVAYQADSFPTDSFTNEYGENFLQSFTDVASEKAAALLQITGNRSVGSAFNNITSSLKQSENPLIKGLGTGLDKGQQTIKDFMAALPGGKGAISGAGLVSSLAAGSRIDFPMLWKSSGFQPSYTMTIRLYNPNPASSEATEKYIIAPIAALMLLGIPVSADGKTYSWPFIHKISSPGIYDLDPAFISNITVIKGGDQQQISYKQSLSVVDVRIDFGSLFNSILAGRQSKGRPTLRGYLNGMRDVKKGVENFSSTTTSSQRAEIARFERLAATTKKQFAKVDEITSADKQSPPERVASEIKTAADAIISQIPTGFKIGI